MIYRVEYGDFKDMATQHMLAPIFSGLKAEKSLSKGDLFIINDTLYKATAAIALNATITIGTNAELASTMAEELSSKIDYYNTGETINFNAGSACLFSGYVAFSSKRIYFSIPLAKKIKSLPTVIIPANTDFLYYTLEVDAANNTGRIGFSNASTILNIEANYYTENILTLSITKKDGTAFVDAQATHQTLVNQSLVNVMPSVTITF